MMSEILAQLYTDHLHISRLLDLLEGETDKMEREESANYRLMALIMDYIPHYPDLNPPSSGGSGLHKAYRERRVGPLFNVNL
jgi:hypothetical protein